MVFLFIYIAPVIIIYGIVAWGRYKTKKKLKNQKPYEDPLTKMSASEIADTWNVYKDMEKRSRGLKKED